MGVDCYGKNPSSERGEHFQNSWWSWRPLAVYVLDVCKDVFEEGETIFWQSNDGQEVSAATSLKIANRLRYLLDSGDVKKYKKGYDRRMGDLPDEQCKFCNSTGTRTDRGNPFTCNACKGSGKVRPMETCYPFTIENVDQFQKFCAASGGFQIC